MSATAPDELEGYLARFGLSTFRPGQKEVISAIVAGRDCLCIMPTGGGKSLCYQLPAVMREGVTLVVSPLIALMKDQVDSLSKLKIRATFVNSSLPPAEQQLRLQQMAAGAYDLMYIAPERLRNPTFSEALRSTRVQLLAVDEAHCISEWGHDFRPDYARLGRFRERLGYPQTIALTATATPTVRHDVVEQLRLREVQTFITGFARPNLRFEVQSPLSGRAKDETLIAFLNENPGAGIIYSATRKGCEELAESLSKTLDRKVGLYHAGLMPEDRRRVQDEFMSGQKQIIVATNAFGMGIDKADLRFVVHYNMPGSLEAYYQEAGRAGRDGQPSRCLLLFSHSDRYIQEFFIENNYPSPDTVALVYEYLRSLIDDPIKITLQELKDRLGLSVGSEGVGACEQLLEKCGALERLSSRQNMATAKIDSQLPTLVDLLPKDAKVQRAVIRAVERIVGDARFEWVYFHPRQLAAISQLNYSSVTRALRELVRLKEFDYVPPFRGRAIHMLKRDCEFDDLRIDFEEREQRKEAEYAKLDRVIRFAQTRRCRQLEILEYFGDPARAACGCCDNCPAPKTSRAKQDEPAEVHNESLLEVVRIVLSGVARCNRRFGKHLVAKMLCGSSSAQITKLRLDKLSTFGLLDELKQTETIEIIDALLQCHLLEQIEIQPHRPIVQLTEFGSEVMRGLAHFDMRLPVRKGLLKKLRKRKTISPSSTDSTKSPGQHTSVKATHTIAPNGVNVDSAADRLDADESNRSAEQCTGTPPDQPQSQPSHYWTWRLLDSGFTVAECAQIRRLETPAIVDHVIRAAEAGMTVEPLWLLSPSQLAVIENLIGDMSPEHIQPLLSRLPPDVRYEHVQYFLACRRNPSSNGQQHNSNAGNRTETDSTAP